MHWEAYGRRARSSHAPPSIPLSPVTTGSLIWNTLILGFREVSLNRALVIKLNLAFLPSQKVRVQTSNYMVGSPDN